MRRRRYLRGVGAVAGSVAFAGCGEDPASSGDDTNEQVYADALRSDLVDAGITVRSLSFDERVTIEYVPAEPTRESVEASINVAAESFFYRIRGGWEVGGLDSSVYVEDTLVATWRMERDWIERYLDGEITREELGQRVRDSVVRHVGTPTPTP